MKAPRWAIHFDHPWSEDVREYGAPIRLHIWTPWGFIMIGERSQVYDRKAKRYTDRYAHITWRPRPWHAKWLDDPAFQRSYARAKRWWDFVERLTGWMKRIPLVGHLAHTFWFCLFTEGIVNTARPRWGALTFAYLNDGFRPTLWHTWQQVTDPFGKYSAIYTDGAPRSLADAQARDRMYEQRRARDLPLGGDAHATPDATRGHK